MEVLQGSGGRRSWLIGCVCMVVGEERKVELVDGDWVCACVCACLLAWPSSNGFVRSKGSIEAPCQ